MKLSWGKFFKPLDTSGRESRTLFFVSVGCAIINISQILLMIKFMWLSPNTTLTEFTTAEVTLGGFYITLIGVWLGREWLKK